MGVCGVTDLGASPGQMSMIPECNAVVGEVIIQILGAMDVGMLMLVAFLICQKHLFWILSLALAYRADTHVGGLACGRSVCVQYAELSVGLLACFELIF